MDSDSRGNRACDTGTWTIHVTGGLHAGATAQLSPAGTMLVGSAADCEVCLADPDVAAHHLLLVHGPGGITARAIDGGFERAGQAFEQGEQGSIGDQCELSLPPTQVTLRVAAHTQPALVRPAPLPRRSPGRFGWLTVAALAALFGTLILARGGVAVGRTSALDANTVIQAQLKQLDLTALVSVESRAGRPVLRGVLEDERAVLLKAELSHVVADIDWEITPVTQLLNRVGEVFRTNGYNAQLEYLGAAQVQVRNLDGENPAVARAAEHVQRDVPALGSLTFAPSQTEPPSDTAAPYPAVPGKRLTTIVDGDTAYVATEDGSRYFVGSVLPGGGQIRQITASGVQIDREGVISWLRF